MDKYLRGQNVFLYENWGTKYAPIQNGIKGVMFERFRGVSTADMILAKTKCLTKMR